MRLILLILVSICLFGCETPPPIPDGTDLRMTNKGFAFPFEIKIYEFDNTELENQDIINEKISCFSDKTTIVWSRINQLESNIKYYLIRDIESIASNIDTLEEFVTLNDKISTSEEIYFTGCYSMIKDVKGKNIPNYNYMYFIDFEEKRFYSIIFQR